jgi:hypothetical protein
MQYKDVNIALIPPTVPHVVFFINYKLITLVLFVLLFIKVASNAVIHLLSALNANQDIFWMLMVFV